MRSLIVVLALALSGCATGPSGRPKGAAELQPMASVEIDRYAGRWYEIARYPNSFERNCQGVTADYTPLPNGRIQVVNTCRAGAPDGQARQAQATARVIAGSNNARIAVNFAPIPLPAGDGNYWILYLDEGYQHALIGEPSGRFLWLLARTPRITPQARAALEAAAAAQGYDLTMLEEVAQP